jgi:propionate CoA-transferase
VKRKIFSADDAIATIRAGDTVACSGFVGVGTPEALIAALQRRHAAHDMPRDLTLVFAAAPGDGKDRGLNRLHAPGLVKRVIGGHWGLVPKLAKLALDNRIEAYNPPLGTLSQLFRDIAGARAGCLTRTGLHTFVDPRHGGGRINTRTTEDLVQLQIIDGEEWLLYKAFPIHVALLRGTSADEQGNITMEREALLLDNLALAMAARRHGGTVIVQVERQAAAGSLHPRQIHIPGVLVDCVVVAEPEHHMQTFGTPFNPAFSGELRVPLADQPAIPLDERKLIGRRCAMELPMGGVVNLGIGMPEAVSAVAQEESALDQVTLTTEPGVIGGMPQGGLNFGAAVNVDALLLQAQQFDFYDGGGLDLAVLGLAQVDRHGHVNVSRFGDRLAGAGGFINISQSARRVVFAGTFTAGGLKVAIEHGQLTIVREGRERKFVDSVDQITFNGQHAQHQGQDVLYVTERCVLRGGCEGLELIEVARGIDIERDILAQMGFMPIVRKVRDMDARLLVPEAMGLRDTMLRASVARRVTFDQARRCLFVNLEDLRIHTRDDVDRLRQVIEPMCQALGHRVGMVANYRNCTISPAVADTYVAAITYLQQNYYDRACRHSLDAVLRSQLGDGLKRRGLALHVCESAAEALALIDSQAHPKGCHPASRLTPSHRSTR